MNLRLGPSRLENRGLEYLGQVLNASEQVSTATKTAHEDDVLVLRCQQLFFL